MIDRQEILDFAKELGLSPEIVEKDYVIGWVLSGIGGDETLSALWAFKGGTCLKKCYLETYRFSEDLDFTVLPGGPIRAEEVAPVIARVLERIHEKSGIAFAERAPLLKTHASGNYTEGRIYYRGPRNTPSVASLEFDLSGSERLARPSVLRSIFHPYPDELPAPGTVRCYSFEEVFAEKIRAMGERSRPRDLYDIINLFRRDDLRRHPALISEVLAEKCVAKGVVVPTFAALEVSPHRAELESEWSNMLVHQLPQLPPFEAFWTELPQLFEWLAGRLAVPELRAAPAPETTDDTWRPPATVWRWGMGVPVESIRFAAANHLCVELGYKGSTRLIEPYAFRRSSAGALLLCAVKVQTRETRTYRVDRMESVKVSNTPFRPTFRIEIGGSGAIAAPQLERQGTARRTPSSRYSHRQGVVYVFACTSCGKKFRHNRNDGTLRQHQTPDGSPCHSRRGYLIDTVYQ
jgi:predicted nucleotidyltransferase component of viral defense system